LRFCTATSKSVVRNPAAILVHHPKKEILTFSVRRLRWNCDLKKRYGPVLTGVYFGENATNCHIFGSYCFLPQVWWCAGGTKNLIVFCTAVLEKCVKLHLESISHVSAGRALLFCAHINADKKLLRIAPRGSKGSHTQKKTLLTLRYFCESFSLLRPALSTSDFYTSCFYNF